MSGGKIRSIVKARLVAGSVVISLPALVRDALISQIKPGDRVSVEVSEDGSCLEVWKE